MNALYAPRADLIDQNLWVETPQTAAATQALWAVLAASRQEPLPWLPYMVLCGTDGVGKTALVGRFIRAAQRNIACSLVERATRNLREQLIPKLPSPEAFGRRDQQRAAWAEEMTRDVGLCPQLCKPAEWVPQDLVWEAIRQAETVEPATVRSLSLRPDQHDLVTGSLWTSEGNVIDDPLRRTNLLFIEADHLLNVQRSKRRWVLERLVNYHQYIGRDRPIALVLVGSMKLAEVVAEHGKTQRIHLAAMPNDENFAQVVQMIFGTQDPKQVAQLHAASGGAMGPLLHIARMRGLEPPYAIPDEEIRRLPAPIPANKPD